MSVVFKKLLFGFLFIFVASSSGAQDEEVEPRRVAVQGPPSANYKSIPDEVSPLSFSFLCFDGQSGLPLACEFEYEYLGFGSEDNELECVVDTSGPLATVQQGTCASGGHSSAHVGERMETFNNSPVQLKGTEDEDSGSFTVKGTQPRNSAGYSIVVQAPEVAGIYSWKFELKTPRGWRLNGSRGLTPDQTQLFISGKNFVRVKNLFQLPESEFYIKLRTNPDIYHSDADAFYATLPMIEAISAFALEYALNSEDNYLLSFNDASLPLAGLFDVKGRWVTPHSTHRGGLDIDLNKVPANAPQGYQPPECLEEVLLHKAALNVLEPYNRAGSTPIHCEEDNLRHLDFSPVIQSILN